MKRGVVRGYVLFICSIYLLFFLNYNKLFIEDNFFFLCKVYYLKMDKIVVMGRKLVMVKENY